jgi:hypothetical protein
MDDTEYEDYEDEPKVPKHSRKIPKLSTSYLVKDAFRRNDTSATLIRDIPTKCRIDTAGTPQEVEIEEIHVKYNSVNVFIGKKGTGKTACALNEALKMSLTGQYHLMIYVCPQGIINDDSFKTLRPLIEKNLPIRVVSTDEIASAIQQLIQYKTCYAEIKEEKVKRPYNHPKKLNYSKRWPYKIRITNTFTLLLCLMTSVAVLFVPMTNRICANYS